jgi:CheY-like chemotaxis protein
VTVRILIAADDPTYGRWLQHRIESLGETFAAVITRPAALQRPDKRLTRLDCELLVAVLDFNAAEGDESPGISWLRALGRASDATPLLVVAEGGTELTAVQALRLGAHDYLPRQLLTPERLFESLHRCLVAIAPQGAAAANGLPRDLVPGYTPLQLLGESSRAQVFLASSARLNRNVALKVERERDAQDSGSALAREYAALSKLNHPGVVQVHEHGQHRDRQFLAMEYFPCGDLRARLQNPLTAAQSLDYLQRVLRALSAVHSAGLLHCDIKPANIMLRENGQCVLIDFGLARPFSELSRGLVDEPLQGSPFYMSPEQAQGLPLDARSDLYSLGVLYHEMLTGRRPYGGTSAQQVLQRHIEDPLPKLPGSLAFHQPLLDGLLAKQPHERYASADELLRVLTVAA